MTNSLFFQQLFFSASFWFSRKLQFIKSAEKNKSFGSNEFTEDGPYRRKKTKKKEEKRIKKGSKIKQTASY